MSAKVHVVDHNQSLTKLPVRHLDGGREVVDVVKRAMLQKVRSGGLFGAVGENVSCVPTFLATSWVTCRHWKSVAGVKLGEASEASLQWEH